MEDHIFTEIEFTFVTASRVIPLFTFVISLIFPGVYKCNYAFPGPRQPEVVPFPVNF